MLDTLNLHLKIVLYGISIIFSMYVGLSFLYSIITLFSLIKSNMLYINYYIYFRFSMWVSSVYNEFDWSILFKFSREHIAEQFINTNRQIFTNIIKSENINQLINSIMFISPAIIVVLALYDCQQQKQFYQQGQTIPSKKHLNRDWLRCFLLDWMLEQLAFAWNRDSLLFLAALEHQNNWCANKAILLANTIFEVALVAKVHLFWCIREEQEHWWLNLSLGCIE